MDVTGDGGQEAEEGVRRDSCSQRGGLGLRVPLPGLETGSRAGFQKMLSSVWDVHEFSSVQTAPGHRADLTELS